MKALLTVFFVTFFAFTSVAQNDEFTPGYYILEKTTQYAVVLPSSVDMETLKNNQQGIESLQMAAGEVVFITNKVASDFLAFDPLGRLLLIRGKPTKAPVTANSGIGRINEELSLVNGDVIHNGSYLWIVSQNVGQNTVTVLMAENKKVEIPSANIDFVNVAWRKKAQELQFKTVVN